MRVGKIVRWEEERGFGFIAPDDGGGQVFVHLNQISGRRSPCVGEEIAFQMGKDQEGRPCAASAWGKDEILEDLKPEVGRRAKTGATRKVEKGAAAFLWNYVALAFLMVLVFAVLFGTLHVGVLGAYVALSVVTFVVYAVDKRAAKCGAWRVSEAALHLWALAGGWPGAVLAQQLLRHKLSKAEFRFLFRVTVLVNCALLVWLAWCGGMAEVVRWVPQSRQSATSRRTPQPKEKAPARNHGSDAVGAAFRARRSNVQVTGSARVSRVLSDDNKGSRHQRFILKMASGQTLLIAHNIDLAPRIPGLRAGDTVDYCGEYEWNAKGGVVHWTHHDPGGRHPGGWLRCRGRNYQ
jgi:uncharacterized membrane protein YsdA (DUF1294 family)/cold shock CspA family protein